jgi:N6-L-threonylcarbamoyladenine synthase
VHGVSSTLFGVHLRDFTILGLETSCDETAAAIVRGHAPGPGTILSNVVLSQLEQHAAFGGVVPEIAARAHVEVLDAVIEAAFVKAAVSPTDIDAIAATAGPGLIGGVMVGLTTAKALALAWDKPLVGVNHLEAHAFTVRLTHGVDFPYLLLLISGGHCQLLGVHDVGRYEFYGTTVDDALGEAFDKVAKLLGLAYPGGPKVEALARNGDPKAFKLPHPMVGRKDANFSFSGLKTAVRQIVRSPGFSEASRADLAASFQASVIASLADRVAVAMDLFRSAATVDAASTLVIAGGVAANSAIRSALSQLASAQDFGIMVPPSHLCTDNGAMIAWAGLEHAQRGRFDDLAIGPRARWPLATASQGSLESAN